MILLCQPESHWFLKQKKRYHIATVLLWGKVWEAATEGTECKMKCPLTEHRSASE